MVRKVRRAKTNSKKLRERADYCRRLAVGVGHPQFTIRLGTLADEYEAMAIEVDAEAAAFDTATAGPVFNGGAVAQDGTRGAPDSPQSLRDRHFPGMTHDGTRAAAPSGGDTWRKLVQRSGRS